MRLTSLITTVVGLGIASGAAYYGQARSEAVPVAEPERTTVEVIAAAGDIPFGAAIEAAHLTTIRWPADAVPPGAFTDMANVLPAPGVEPRRASRSLVQGEILLSSRLSDFGEKVTIVQTLGPNNRAIAIEVDARSGVGGFVTPGDRVDIVLTQGRGAELSAVTVLQNIRVVGVDQKADEQVESPSVARTVTVEVTPEQSQRLALAQRAGQLMLSLRSPDSTDAGPLPSTSLQDILPRETPEAAPEPEPAQVIRVRRGAHDVETLSLN